jgi:hypothetical protein
VVDDWFFILEGIGETVAKVNAAMRDGTEPEPMRYNPTWCDKCDAAAICPTMAVLRGAGSISHAIDGELDRMCSRFLSLRPDRDEYNAAERRIKKYAEACGLYDGTTGEIKTLVSGEHRVTVEHKPRGRYLTVLPLTSDDTEE